MVAFIASKEAGFTTGLLSSCCDSSNHVLANKINLW
jgi:hypothetical protein